MFELYLGCYLLTGLGQEKVFLSGCESGDVMLSLCCEPVGRTSDEEACDTKLTPDFLLTNVSLDAHNLEICILINSGHVLLENCKVSVAYCSVVLAIELLIFMLLD
jgi:hypothetical protein